jgi:hypothetical protein
MVAANVAKLPDLRRDNGQLVGISPKDPAQRMWAGPWSASRILLSAANILSVALPASAATRHHRLTRISPIIYNGVPNGVSLNTSCLPTDSPCRTKPDSW